MQITAMTSLTVTLYNEETGDLVDVQVSTFRQLLSVATAEFGYEKLFLYHDGKQVDSLDGITDNDIVKVVRNLAEPEPERYNNIYIAGVVNNYKIKMIVDCGAQVTMMSMQLVQRLELEHLIDRKYRGVARGMGSAEIIGKIFACNITIGTDLVVAMDITVADIDDPVMCLIGLDFLYPNKCAINFDTNMLYTKNHQVPLLSSAEIKTLGIPINTTVEKINRSYRDLKKNLGYKTLVDTNTLLKKIVNNILTHPTEKKYQRININSKALTEIYQNPFCKAFIQAIGFKETSDAHIEFNENKCTLLTANKVIGQ